MTITATPIARDLTKWEVAHLARLREMCTGQHSAELIAEVDAMEQAWRVRLAPGPCLPFCQNQPGHGWSDDDPRGTVGRYHSTTFGHGAFYVSVFEQANTDGTTTMFAPEVLLEWDVRPSAPISDPLYVADVADGGHEAARLVTRILAGEFGPVTTA